MDELPSHIPSVKIIPDLKDAQPLAMAAQMRQSGAGRVFGAYTLHAGLYSQYPLAHQRTHKRFGPVFVAVYEGGVVAFSKLNLTWVHPDHRGKGLGPELRADFSEAVGGHVWPSKVTTQGVKLNNRAQQVLLARERMK